MGEREIVGVAASFLILIVFAFLEYKRWLPAAGKFKFVLMFIAGASIVGALRAAGIPPWWFSGEGEAFGLAVMLFLSGFVAEREAGRTFGMPMLFGMAATLAVLNVLPHVT